MNRVMLIGRLTAKPELRYTGSNVPFARFSVAVNRTFSNAQGQRETDFINIIVWRKQAENTCNYLDKGSLVSIEGRLQTGSYDDLSILVMMIRTVINVILWMLLLILFNFWRAKVKLSLVLQQMMLVHMIIRKTTVDIRMM